MLNNLDNILVKGEFFIDGISWKFSSNSQDNKDRLFLVYGENGTGKTTFSKSIYEYKVSSQEFPMKNFEYVTFKDAKDNEININKDNVWSFNDEFIQKNVRIKENGLNAIVMLGEANDIDDLIDEKKRLLKDTEQKLKSINLNSYTEKGNPNCVEDALKNILELVKQNWAIKDKEIKQGSRNSSVSEGILQKIVKVKTTGESVSVLEKTFKNKLDTYLKLPKDGIIVTTMYKTDYSYSEENKIISLLDTQLNKPISNELESLILKELNNKDYNTNIADTKKIVNNRIKICPLCFQNISPEHNLHLAAAINNVFNKEADNHISHLKEKMLQFIDNVDFSTVVNIIDSQMIMEINSLIEKINKKINQYNAKITEKITNVYTAIKCDDYQIERDVRDLNNKFEDVNNKITQYNLNIKNITKLRKDLDDLNLEICFLLIKPQYLRYEKLLSAKESDGKAYSNYLQKIGEITKEINDLKAKKGNLDIGLKQINMDLMLICHSKKRLALVLEEGKYFVTSNGKRIKFNNLSVGEKNIIGLCYFFSLIRQNHTKNDVFKEEMFVVIDDPISSFDFNNKYGIYSYIKRMISDILNGNRNSKVIIMTHELEALANFDKIRADLGYKDNNFKIDNKQLVKFSIDSIYVRLFKTIIDSACQEQEITSERMNSARRVLEAFSQFSYNEGPNVFSRDDKVFELISDEKLREYLKTQTYRILLNTESHTQEMIKQMPENMGYDMFSNDEKRQVIKDICVLIYNLNPLHIEKMINEKNKNRFEIVKQWHEEIVNNLNEIFVVVK